MTPLGLEWHLCLPAPMPVGTLYYRMSQSTDKMHTRSSSFSAQLDILFVYNSSQVYNLYLIYVWFHLLSEHVVPGADAVDVAVDAMSGLTSQVLHPSSPCHTLQSRTYLLIW